MPSNTRRFSLRERTSDAHASLDQLTGPFRSVADYGRYALGLHAFRTPIEEKLAAVDWPSISADWRPQLIGHALREDLIDLGITPSVGADVPPLLQSLEGLLGTLYVLEGSALGAKILYRRAQAIGLSESCGARHLALQSVADNWRKFLVVLEQETAVDFESIVAASNAIFQAAERAFREFQHVDPQPA